MAYRLYPVTETEMKCDDYKVKINGDYVALDTARVSAVPFNRRWPGHQRQTEQSETVNFLSLATDEPLEIEVFPKEPFENVIIRPQSAGIKYEITEHGSILIELDRPRYFTVEPYGRRHALHIFADSTEKYGIDPSDANVIYFGAGEHDAGTIELHSGDTLFIDEGAVVYGSVKAFDVKNIKIIGHGILDNSKNKETILFEASAEGNRSAVNNAIRTHTVQLEYCDNALIDGITIRDSLVYNIRPVACTDLTVRNVKIIGCWRFNSDGIDMHNCENVLIENCFIRTFDDSVCVKGFDCYYDGDVEKAVYEAMHYGGRSYENFRNITVRKCVIWNDWGRALEIGAETRAEEITGVLFEDSDVIHATHDALDCQNVDYADVHGVTYRNIRVELDDVIPEPKLQKSDAEKYASDERDYAPSVISAYVKYHYEYSAGGSRRGVNRDLLFEDIYVYGRHKPILTFKGYSEEYGCRDITVRGLYLNGKRLTENECTVVTNEFCKNIKIE